MAVPYLLKPSIPIAILRMTLGAVFMAHAIARLYHYSLPGFGEFLDSKGFPLGFCLAWAITVFELTGGFLFSIRKFVTLFCLGEMIILLTGIVLVHWQNGWFVVGMTLGGIEYSVVLIIVLLAVLLAERTEKKI